jgi:hypothetical protein
MGNDQSVVKYSPSSTQRMCFGYLSELLLIPRCHESRPSRRRVHARGRRCLCPGQRVHARSRAPVGLPRPRAIYLPTWRLADRRSAPLETESEASLAAPPTGRRHGGGQPPSHQTRVVPPARHWEPRLHGCAVHDESEPPSAVGEVGGRSSPTASGKRQPLPAGEIRGNFPGRVSVR